MPKILLPYEYQKMAAKWIHLSYDYPKSSENIWPPSNVWVLFHFAQETTIGRKFRIGTCVCLDPTAGRFSFSFPDGSALYPPTAWMPLTFVVSP